MEGKNSESLKLPPATASSVVPRESSERKAEYRIYISPPSSASTERCVLIIESACFLLFGTEKCLQQQLLIDSREGMFESEKYSTKLSKDCTSASLTAHRNQACDDEDVLPVFFYSSVPAVHEIYYEKDSEGLENKKKQYTTNSRSLTRPLLPE